MDSDDDSLGEDHQPNPGIQNFEAVKAPDIRESSSSQVRTRNPRPSRAAVASNLRVLRTVDVNRQPSTSSGAVRLGARQPLVHNRTQPQTRKVSFFGYSFWLFPIGHFDFLDFGRQNIYSVQDKHAPPGLGPLTSRMLGAGCPSTSNPVASLNNNVTKKTGSQDPSTSINQGTMMKHEEENSDDSEEMQQALSPSEANVPNKSNDNAGSACAKPGEDGKKSNNDEAVGVASGYDSPCAGPSGTQKVDGPLPCARRKRVEEMNRAEMDEHFRYICEDTDSMAIPILRPQEPPRLAFRRQLEEAEHIVSRRQMRQFNVEMRPFMKYCNALLRNELPSPDYSEDSDDEHEWLGPHISRRSRRVPPIPDIRAIFNSHPRTRFPVINVFPYENLMFISIRRHGARDNETVRVNNVNYDFPDYCVETSTHQGAITTSLTLMASIDNFCNMRAVQGLSLDTFDRDFNYFLASMNHGGTVYQIGTCRVRLGWCR